MSEMDQTRDMGRHTFGSLAACASMIGRAKMGDVLVAADRSSREGGFILNRHDHWIAIRLVGGTYWDLNSTLEYPGEARARAARG